MADTETKTQRQLKPFSDASVKKVAQDCGLKCAGTLPRVAAECIKNVLPLVSSKKQIKWGDNIHITITQKWWLQNFSELPRHERLVLGSNVAKVLTQALLYACQVTERSKQKTVSSDRFEECIRMMTHRFDAVGDELDETSD